MEKVSIYEFDFDVVKEWIAAHNENDAKKIMLENWNEEDLPKCRVLTEQEMDDLKHSGEDGEDRENPLTFRQRLEEYKENGISFPTMFATTEI